MANRVWAHFRPASEPLTPRITRQCSKKKRDRKSTRLNSSHLVISYAVFCLKKKTRLNSSHLVISYAVFCLKKKKIMSYDSQTTIHCPMYSPLHIPLQLCNVSSPHAISTAS